MSYANVSVIVDGALEDDLSFTDECVMREFIGTVEDEAKSHGYPTEVYVQYHDHELTEDDCSCAQFETAHQPAYSFNMERQGATPKDGFVSALVNLQRVVTEYVDTPHGHYTREWVTLPTMRAWFGRDLRQFRAWQWRRDTQGTVWFAMYH